MPLEFLESAQQFRRSGGLEIAPPPSEARYKNTPVGRGLIEVFLLFRQNFVATLLFSQGGLLDSNTYLTSASSARFKRYLAVEPIGTPLS